MIIAMMCMMLFIAIIYIMTIINSTCTIYTNMHVNVSIHPCSMLEMCWLEIAAIAGQLIVIKGGMCQIRQCAKQSAR